jgi:hypothetical protein
MNDHRPKRKMRYLVSVLARADPSQRQTTNRPLNGTGFWEDQLKVQQAQIGPEHSSRFLRTRVRLS